MKVYVSSTQADLAPYRAAVMAAVRRLGHEYVAMEDYGPDAKIPAQKVQEDVAGCDIYVCIVAWRYGFVPAGYDCSITELEYRKAVEEEIPIWAFLLSEDVPWLPKLVDGGEPGARRIDKFRDELKQRHTISWFRSENDLRANAAEAIFNLLAQLETEKDDEIVKPQVSLARLPSTGAARFGRQRELEQMDNAWRTGRTNVLSIVAWGGVGKSALINAWLAHLANENYRGASRAFGWSFHNQERETQETSSDAFFTEALTWFKDKHPTLGSPWEKGQRLAELISRERTILVLDGLEVLQQSSDADEGGLRDQGMLALLRGLAWQNPGLCLIATRFGVADLKTFINNTVEEIRLNHLAPEAGAELLRSLGVQGSTAELIEASKEFGGHALALELLGGYLVSECEGDVRRRDVIVRHEGDGASRTVGPYEQLLGEGPATELLRMLALFDGPAHSAALNAVLRPPRVVGLTSYHSRFGDAVWKPALQKLRRWKLVSEKSESRPEEIETHALVRQHFSQQLREKYPAAWRKAHDRLFEYYQKLPSLKQQPDTFEGLVPLFQAVVHGCQAERYQEAWESVYWPRIRREYDGFSVLTLNAYGADLATLAHFFKVPYEEPDEALDEVARARLCTETAFDLRGLGRLDEALVAQRFGLEAHCRIQEKLEHPDTAENLSFQRLLRDSGYNKWWEGADAAGNLSELLVAMGELGEATEVAGESIDLAKKSDDQMEVSWNLATLAAALHQRGEFETSELRFREAEALQNEVDNSVQYLQKLPCYNFCDLLLGQGRFEEVRTRATAALQAAVRSKRHYAIGLAYLALARMHTLETQAAGATDFSEALKSMEFAREELRLAGHEDLEVRGLLASAELSRITGAHDQAEAALQRAQAAAVRGQMRLLQSDILLEYARLYLASARVDEGRRSLREAKQRIYAMGYHRRDAELQVLTAACGS